MTEVEGKMKLPVVDRGYDIAATDAYISMLQEEYNKIYAWGSELEKRAEAPAGEAASSEEIEALRTQNRSLYNNCVAFAKHIKRLEKLRDDQGRYMVDELNAAESRKKALEKEISDLEAQKSLLKVSNESARGQSDAIVTAARSQAQKTVTEAQEQANAIVAEAQNARATAMLFIVVFIFPFPFLRLTFPAFVVIFAPFGRFYTLFYTLLLF